MDTIFLTLLSLCLPASILIIIAILFRFVFKKAPKWLMGIMWTIVALRLIIPFQFESSIGFLPNVGNRLEAFFIGNNESDSIVYVVEDNNEFVSSEIITHEYTPNSVAPNEPDDVVHDYLPNETITVTPNNNDIPEVVTGRREMMIRLQMIWLFGVLVMLAYAVFSYVSIRKKIRTSIKLDSYDNVFECDEISTPFILGIFKPTIYIPSGLDENTVKNVLAHENSHIKRLDHIRKQLGFIILAGYWFNPLVWIAYILFCKDIELACDEKVISKMSFDEKKSYASSLLLCSAHKKLVLAYPLAFGEVAVKTRIKNIFNYKTPALWVIMIGIVLCSALGFGFMTCKVNADEEIDSTIQDNVEKIIISEDNIQKTEEPIKVASYNQYYNVSTKVCKGKTFIETADGIYVAEADGSRFTLVTDGLYSLGAAGKDGVYLCEYIQKDERYQYNLAYLSADDYSIITLAENLDLSNSNGVSHYSGMYIEGKHLYVEGADCFISYYLRSDTEVIEEGPEHNLIYKDFTYSAVYYAGLINAYISDRDEHAIGNLNVEIADGNWNIIEGVGDVMLTRYGALVKKAGSDAIYNNVYLVSYSTGEEKLVYDAQEHDGLYAGYNTYDENGFYGLQYQGEGKYSIIYCTWDGEVKELYKFNTSEKVVGAQMAMSIVDDWLYFNDLSSGTMKRININNCSSCETIE